MRNPRYRRKARRTRPARNPAGLSGRAMLGLKTKELVPLLGASAIPIINHENIDRVAAESLVEAGVGAVVNAAGCSTGHYPNLGPLVLARAGVCILDNVGPKVFDRVKDGDVVEVRGEELYREGELVAVGTALNLEAVEKQLRESREGVGDTLESFARNTVEFMRLERDILFSTLDVPQEIVDKIRGRQVLVVVRGYDYRQDLEALGPYIRGEKPFIIGVDGGADAVLEAGWRPDLVFGDMDSVSDKALLGVDHVLVHGYETGRAPGLARVEEAGVEGAKVLAAPGLSEDIAILLAEQSEAELIVAVGTHVGLVEFLDKGRKGASSTFLMRLKVGARLVDAKGVSKLYPSRVSAGQLLALLVAGLVVVSVVVFSSEPLYEIFRVVAIRIRLLLGV